MFVFIHALHCQHITKSPSPKKSRNTNLLIKSTNLPTYGSRILFASSGHKSHLFLDLFHLLGQCHVQRDEQSNVPLFTTAQITVLSLHTPVRTRSASTLELHLSESWLSGSAWPNGKFVENSTILTYLEIVSYRIKYSTVLWLLELKIRRGRKV